MKYRRFVVCVAPGEPSAASSAAPAVDEKELAAGNEVDTVEILNPYNEKEFLNDKLSVVDVKARDAAGVQYQIELQLLNHRDLIERIVYGWTDLHRCQLKEGQDYGRLRPTYAIWLLGAVLRPDVPGYAHDIGLRDADGGRFGASGCWRSPSYPPRRCRPSRSAGSSSSKKVRPSTPTTCRPGWTPPR